MKTANVTATIKTICVLCVSVLILISLSGCIGNTEHINDLYSSDGHLTLQSHAFEEAIQLGQAVEPNQEPGFSLESSSEYSPVYQSTFEWRIGIDDFGEQFYYRLPVVINGMKLALGVDRHGAEVVGWVRETDMLMGMYSWLSVEETLQLQRERSARFYETGEYAYAINLYSDAYATNIIGVHYIIVYPRGQGLVHGFDGGTVYIECQEEMLERESEPFTP